MIPTYEQMMLPILTVLSDGSDWSRTELREAVAEKMHLSDEDLQHLLPSGTQTTVGNRINWACHRLVKAGLIERIARGVARITEGGRAMLADHPVSFGETELRQIPDYRAWIEQTAVRSESEPSKGVIESSRDETPEAQLELAHRQHRLAIEDELLTRVRQLEPAGFERMVVGLLLAMGYGVKGDGEHIGRSGDGGVDGVIREDKLGLDLVYIQAKRWGGSVGRPEIQAFVGSLAGLKARKGVFITTSSFSREAYDYLNRIETRIVLIDGPQLARLMFDTGVGVTVRETFEVKAVDSDYFDDV
ncbi:MAG: restriction endonuclease [Dehalococcoidia bacterium]